MGPKKRQKKKFKAESSWKKKPLSLLVLSLSLSTYPFFLFSWSSSNASTGQSCGQMIEGIKLRCVSSNSFLQNNPYLQLHLENHTDLCENSFWPAWCQNAVVKCQVWHSVPAMGSGLTYIQRLMICANNLSQNGKKPCLCSK